MFFFSQRTAFGIATLAITLFFAFGLYHITQFETTDEHFWKYDRIPAYWQALEEGKWKKTAINDKPGITIALMAGPGLLFVNPTEHRLRDPELTQHDTLTLYDTTQTARINLAFRLPLLLCNTLLLFLSFFLAQRAFRSDSIAASFIVALVSFPFLIGLSQIINPDTLLWSTSSVALLAWLAFLETGRFRYACLTAVFTALALLSKYTGNFLFPLFLALGILHPLFRPTFLSERAALQAFLRSLLLGFVLVLLISPLIFAFFLPAVFVKPALLFQGTLGFLHTAHLLFPLLFIVLLLAFDTLGNQARSFFRLFQLTPSPSFRIFTRTTFFLAILFFALTLCLGNILQPFLETAKTDGALAFPLLASWPAPLAFGLQILGEASAFVFSVPPLLWALLFFWFLRSLFLPLTPRTTLTLLLLWFTIAFCIAALGQGVLLNARYSVIFFPLLALLLAFALDDLATLIPNRFHPKTALLIGLLCLSAFTLWYTKPFFFNYTSPLLQSSFALHDGWGLGYYEAAQYLNSLPNKDQLIIWSDRNVICPFLTGPRCLSGYQLDLSRVTPDYFIVSKRGVERNYIPRDRATKQPLLDYTRLSEYAREAVWRLNIGNRPDNFVMILPASLP
jgi:hypothetical protein